MEPPASSNMYDADLTKGMEHMRPYVSVSNPHPSEPTKPVQETHNIYGVPSTLINPPRQPTQRPTSPSNPQKRSDPFQFGSRYLSEGDDIFQFNAWDHVSTDAAYKEFSLLQYQRQRDSPVSDFDKSRYNASPEKWWNRFYTHNTTNFFKDRKWLFQEFPTLAAATSPTSPPVTILELGAGAGNTAFPILANNRNEALKIHACDYAPKAVELIRANAAYDGMFIQADVWDVASTRGLPPGLGPDSVDIAVMIFVFSALEPGQWTQALGNLYRLLKPGGEVLFRDYGRGDLAQVRFKKGRWLDDNFYARGDGTRVYFFEKEELAEIWSGSAEQNGVQSDGGLQQEVEEGGGSERIVVEEKENGQTLKEQEEKAKYEDQEEPMQVRPHFEIVDLGVDRRMLVNRQRKLKMYRCWMQGRFRKPWNT